MLPLFGFCNGPCWDCSRGHGAAILRGLWRPFFSKKFRVLGAQVLESQDNYSFLLLYLSGLRKFFPFSSWFILSSPVDNLWEKHFITENKL